MVLKYFSFSIAITFISFIVGMIMTSLIRKTNFFDKNLSNLNFIKSEFLNIIIGVGVIKWMVKKTFLKFFNQKLKINRKMNISDIRIIRNEMTNSEIDHLFAFIFVTIFVIVQLYNQKHILAIIMFFVNIIMNLYPALLQQQNKRRIDKLISKFDKGQIKLS